MRKTAARKSGRSNKRKILFIDGITIFLRCRDAFIQAFVRALGIVILPIDRRVSYADTPNDDDDDDDDDENRW